MGIPPFSKFGVQTEVVLADINSSQKSDSPVDDYNFAVVPVVHPSIYRSNERRQEKVELNPRLL
ncbi:hypothetical protein D3C71_2114490 [compost metagenome]